MDFYKVIFHSVPRVGFAHSHRTEHYDLSIQRPHGNMEISYIKEGACEKRFAGGRVLHIPAPSISTTVFDGERVYNKSDAPLHIHYTFSLQGDWTAYPHTADEILSCMRSGFLPAEKYPLSVLLPVCTSDMKCVSALAPCFYEIITAHSGNSPFRTVSCMEQVFRIFSVLTDWCIAEALRIGEGSISPSGIAYCRRAAEYMQTYISRHITAEEIANELQISPAHLSRIFKAVTGTTLIEYNNRLKINHAKQLLENQNLPLREVAAQIGIADEKYFSRLFKKYTGMTTGAFKKSV